MSGAFSKIQGGSEPHAHVIFKTLPKLQLFIPLIKL